MHLFTWGCGRSPGLLCVKRRPLPLHVVMSACLLWPGVCISGLLLSLRSAVIHLLLRSEGTQVLLAVRSLALGGKFSATARLPTVGKQRTQLSLCV